jgi:hypothetical protein
VFSSSVGFKEPSPTAPETHRPFPNPQSHTTARSHVGYAPKLIFEGTKFEVHLNQLSPSRKLLLRPKLGVENDDLSSSTSYIGSNLLLNPLKQQYGLKIFLLHGCEIVLDFPIKDTEDNEVVRRSQ